MFSGIVIACLDGLDRNATKLLGILVGITLLIGVVYSVHLDDELRYPDERDYVQLAEHLKSTGQFGYEGARAFRPPLYPVLLGAFSALGLPIVALRFLNFVTLAGCMFLLYRILSRAIRPAAGVFAAAWVLAYPVLAYTAGTLYPQTLAGFLLLLFVAALCESPTWEWTVAAGLCFGLLILTVPSFLPLIGVGMLWVAYHEGKPGIKRALLLGWTTALLPAAWVVRNRLVLGDWPVISSNSGVNFLLGNSPNTTAQSGVNADLSYLSVPPELTEVETSRFYQSAAFQWIGSHPMDALWLYVQKFIQYFGVSETLATASEGSEARTLIMTVTYAPLLAAMLVRLLTIRRWKWTKEEQLFFALYVVNGLAMAVFFTRIRFRVPLDLLAIGIASVCAVRVLETLAERAKTD